MKYLAIHITIALLFAFAVWPDVGAAEEAIARPAAETRQAELVGIWTSVRFGGKDIGDNIQSIEYEFRANGSFRCSGKLKDKGKVSYEGTYSPEDGKLRMMIPGQGTRLMPFKILSGVLRLRDQDLDSWVEYRKKDAEQADTGQPATQTQSKSEGSDKPQPEAEGRSR